MTTKFVKTDIVTSFTISCVTIFLAVVQLAGEKFIAEERTGMFYSDTTSFSALVSSTTSLLLTSSLTASVIRPGGQLGAVHHRVHAATPTPHTRGQRTGRTLAGVTPGLTIVRRRRGAT